MSTTSYYDVIVVGTDLAGLLAAGLLRRRNYRVLLVGHGGLADHYEHESHRLAALPRSLPLRAQAPLLTEVLDKLAVEDPVHQVGVNKDTHLQVVTPKQRIDLFQDHDRLATELERMVPEQKDAFLEAVDRLRALDERFCGVIAQRPQLPPEGLRERSRLNKLAKHLQEVELIDESGRPPLMNILHQATTFISNLDPANRSPAATAHLILSLLSGVRTVPDLADRLVDANEKAGVDLQLPMVAEQLLLDGNAVIGMRALRSANRYHCGVMLASLPLSEAVELIPSKMRRQRARLAGDAARPLRSVFAVNAVLPKDALPLGMGPNLLLVRSANEPLVEDNLIRVQCLPDPQGEERVQICLSCIVDHRKRSLGREYLAPLQQRMLEAAAWLIPFLDAHILDLSSPFWSARDSDTGHPSPWLLHRTIETVKPADMGVAVHSLRTPLRNLLLCGPEVIPGLGVEGEALAALQAVRWLEENRKLKSIY